MLKRIFAAFTTLAERIETFAETWREANELLRERLMLDHRENVPALPGPEPEEAPPRRNGRTKAGV